MPRFDDAWPELEVRLRRSLTARGVPAQDRDDVVQETALRVYRVWESLDPSRSAWPFVVTVAVNFWRDVMRERTGRIAQVQPMATIEVTDHHDVERDVLARQELASVRIAWRALAPEQRRLLLATEEFADSARPLLPAERVARMRVRRQLARAVGRASALVPLMWLRRPGRATSVVAAAYASAIAATMLTTPAMVTAPLVTALPHPAHVHAPATHARHLQPGLTKHRVPVTTHADSSHATATAPAVPIAKPAVGILPTMPTAAPTRVCSPVQLPLSLGGIRVKVDASPGIVAKASSGCVGIDSTK